MRPGYQTSLAKDGEYLMKFRAGWETSSRGNPANPGNLPAARLAKRQWVAIIGRMLEGFRDASLVSPE
jgi:hypothetical protein